MPTLESLQNEIDLLKERNKRVEADKAWETSWPRRALILALTYIVITLFFFAVGLSKPFVNAIVPSVGFALSTLTIPIIKKMWVRQWYR